jgi:antibiotic biosynthesis monooxygenase (ABM) superfamily enzyme
VDTPTSTITVSITRTVKAGREAAFEQALHEFVQRSLSQDGQLGVHIMRPAPGSESREYGIVRKFAHREALAAFHESPEYLAWKESVAGLTEGDARVEELTGLESWFTLPGAPLRPLPKYKLFVATLLGVYPTQMGLGVTLGIWTNAWSFPLGSLVFDTVMVACLTWAVMPLITRLINPWIHPI